MLYLRCRLKDFSFTCSKRRRAAWHRLCLTLQNLTRRDGTWGPTLTFCLSWRYFKTRVASLTPSQLWASLSVNNCSFLCLSTHDATPVLIVVPLSFSFQSTYLAVPSMFCFFSSPSLCAGRGEGLSAGRKVDAWSRARSRRRPTA